VGQGADGRGRKFDNYFPNRAGNKSRAEADFSDGAGNSRGKDNEIGGGQNSFRRLHINDFVDEDKP